MREVRHEWWCYAEWWTWLTESFSSQSCIQKNERGNTECSALSRHEIVLVETGSTLVLFRGIYWPPQLERKSKRR